MAVYIVYPRKKGGLAKHPPLKKPLAWLSSGKEVSMGELWWVLRPWSRLQYSHVFYLGHSIPAATEPGGRKQWQKTVLCSWLMLGSASKVIVGDRPSSGRVCEYRWTYTRQGQFRHMFQHINYRRVTALWGGAWFPAVVSNTLVPSQLSGQKEQVVKYWTIFFGGGCLMSHRLLESLLAKLGQQSVPLNSFSYKEWSLFLGDHLLLTLS